MTTTIPGIADKMREEAAHQPEYRKYGDMRKPGVLTAIRGMSDSDIVDLSPAGLDRLSAEYPKGSDDWREWDRFRQRLDTLLDRTEMNEWSKRIIERAFSHRERTGRAA